MWPFSDFQNGFRSSRSTADLLTVVSDRIAGAFNRSGTTRAMALDISKTFDRVCHGGLLHKLRSWGISCQIFGLISSVVDGFEWFWMESLHGSIQLVLKFRKGPLLVLHFSSCILMTFLMVLSVVLVSMLMILFILGVIRHLICDGSLSWFLNLNLIYWTLWANYFMSAKKCQHESCIIDFTSAKMEFASAIFKKMYFSKYSIKYVVNRLPPLKKLL